MDFLMVYCSLINFKTVYNSKYFNGNYFIVIKLLKNQIRYLGRNWRKGHMKIMSLIYHKIRHRVNDDWAFANGENVLRYFFFIL